MYSLLFFLLGVSVIAAVVGVVASILLILLLFRLRTKHSAYWQTVGSPWLISWLWRGSYDDLNDWRTVGIARLVRTLFIVFIAGEAASLTAMYLLKSWP